MIKYERLKPNETTTDPRFQRDIEVTRVEGMAAAYKRSRLGVPVLSHREDGTLVQIDGQHRISTLTAAGLGDIPVMMEIHSNLTLEDEAQLFYDLNHGRKAVGPIDKYKARLVFKEATATAIQAILKKNGCKISKNVQRGGIQAVQAVEHVYHRHNLDATIATLVMWLDHDPAAFDGDLIRAISVFLAACPSADPELLAKKLETVAPAKLIAQLRREVQQLSSGTRADAARLVLTNIYNRGTHRTKRVSWQPDQSRPSESHASA